MRQIVVRYPACAGQGGANIRQLADVATGLPGDAGGVEIRISLDRIDPPAGRLRVMPGPGAGAGSPAARELPFTGWLGLLRVLYEVTGSSASGAPDEW
jgi:hypothetical protein